MKKPRLSALALTGAVTLTLAACSPREPEATPTPAPTPSMNVVTAAPAPTASAEVVTPDPQPTESVNVIAPPAETDAVVLPLETQAPAPTPEPTVQPTAEPADDRTAAGAYAAVAAVAGGDAMSDVSFALEAYYNLSSSDLEDFVFYMPDMSTQKQEIFLAKVASGKLEDVKAACESRLHGLREETEFYAGTGDYVDSYRLVTSGEWLLFCVCENPDSAVTAFNDYTK